MAKQDVKEKILELMTKPDHIRNMGIIAHVDHGKTTLCDSLLAGAGIISDELAGEQTWMDYDDIEQKRQMTIKSANCSMIHESGGETYLINLIDTPGHVDFGGEVTRALRAVDGCVVVSDAVEGVMPQTEAVLRQALKEHVRPVLFLNKVDRLIRELQLTPEEMQKQFLKIIGDVNEIVDAYAPEDVKNKWKVSVEGSSVGFGSAFNKWAVNFPLMKQSNLKFADIIRYVQENKQVELHKLIPVHKVILDMVIRHLPNPMQAQSYRIPKIWHGDLESEVGKSLLACNPDGPMIACVTKVVNDPHAGVVACSRIFSGTLRAGTEVNLISAKGKTGIQQIGVYKGPFRILVDAIPSGNIVAIVGLKDADAGETLSSEPQIEPFESLKHIFDPVVTKAIEPKEPRDLPKLIEALKEISREDTTLKVTINQETGEYLIAGLGELHLEVWQTRLERDWKVNAVVSEPVVVYRETVTETGPETEGKSPNKHNKFYIIVEPVGEQIYEAMATGDIWDVRVKKKDEVLWGKLIKCGMDKDEAKKVVEIYNQNMFIDMTRGQVNLIEVIDTVLEGFRNVMDQGPIAREKCSGLKIKLMDCSLHEDAIHRGPAQVIPAIRESIRGSMFGANPMLLEPVQKLRIDVPQENMGVATALIQSRRGRVLDMKEERGGAVITGKLPVASMFGFTNELRSGTAGRGFWSLVDSKFEQMPKELQIETVTAIRKRKGLVETQ